MLMSGLFRITSPVLFGYFPLGITFGILFQDLGYPWYSATLMGLVVYAGAAQFMAIGLLTAGAGLLEVALSTFLLNSRHLFFGLSLLKQFGQWGFRKLYLIFGLTDETYSLITTLSLPEGEKRINLLFRITALNQFYWVAGCTVGGFVGGELLFNTEGMEFALVALFAVLMIEQWKRIRRFIPFLVAAFSTLLLFWLYPEQLLVGAMVLSIVLLLIMKQDQEQGDV